MNRIDRSVNLQHLGTPIELRRRYGWSPVGIRIILYTMLYLYHCDIAELLGHINI